MYTKKGIIIEKNSNVYRVKLVEHEECKKCVGCKKWIDKEDVLDVVDTGDYVIGSRVVVGMDEGQLLKMGFFVYMVPIFFMFSGMGLSFMADTLVGYPMSPGRAVVAGLVLMFGAFWYFIRRFNGKCRDGEIKLKIIQVLEEK